MQLVMTALNINPINTANEDGLNMISRIVCFKFRYAKPKYSCPVLLLYTTDNNNVIK